MTDVKNIGRLRYFDPNTSVYQNQDGGNSDSITFPYEDYNIAVDLQVEMYNRYSCGMGKLTGDMTAYTFSTKEGTISFLGGTNGVLTTNYTDIQMVNPSGNTAECFGIESINISYDSWLHPTVNIKFVDVRGGTIMQPAEANYYEASAKGNTYQLYKALFSFPYPLFKLKVKGFYGRGVTYRLAVSRTDIELDASSGNFVLTVDFIGHIYGFFADMPFTYVAIAPYMNEGDRYWQEKITDANKTFWFYTRDANGKEIPQCPMLKFPELAEKAAKVAYSQEMANINSEQQEVEQSIENEIEDLKTIQAVYKELIGSQGTISYFDEFPDIEGDKYRNFSFILMPYSLFNDYETLCKDKFISNLVQFHELVKGHDDTFKTNYIKRMFGESDSLFNDEGAFSKASSYGKYSWFVITGEKYGDKRGYYVTGPGSKMEGSSNGKSIRSELYGSNYQNSNNGKNNFEVFINYFYDFKKNHNITNNICVICFSRGTNNKWNQIMDVIVKDDAERARKSKEDKDREIRRKRDSYVEKALGFRPSVKNLYDLAFAHLDTFMHVYYTALGTIHGQLSSKSVERSKITYSISDEYTDTEPSSSISGEKGFVRGAYLPPFTGFFKDSDELGEGSKKKTSMWAGELTNGETYLEEVKLVYELLAGSKLYFDKADDANNKIESYKQNASDVSTVDVSDFIPLTIYEIANFERCKNPYESLASKFDSNANINEIIGDFYMIFALRLFYYVSTLGKSGGTDNESKCFGRFEAVNFYKAVKKSSSLSLKKFCGILADDKNLKSNRKDFESSITSSVETPISKSWHFGSEILNNKLFDEVGRYYKYGFTKTDKSSGSEFDYLPIGITSVNDIKNDFSNGFPWFKDGYISTINHSAYSGLTSEVRVGETLHGGTFMIREDGNYVNDLLESVNTDIKNGEGDVENTITEVDKYDLKRESSTFGMYADNFGISDGYVSTKCLCNKDGGKLSDTEKETIENGNFNGPNDLPFVYVKTPEFLDEGSTKTQLAANGEHFIEKAISIFETPIYWLQETGDEETEEGMFGKAYLFIQSIPLKGKYMGLFNKPMGIGYKMSFLREGAFYWWQANNNSAALNTGYVNGDFNSGVLIKRVCTKGDVCVPMYADKSGKIHKSEAKYCAYKEPRSWQTFMSEWGLNHSTRRRKGSDFITSNPMSEIDCNAKYYDMPYLDVSNDSENSVTYDDDFKMLSNSRREYLIKYWEKWVEEEFIPVHRSLENLNLYSESDGKRQYRNGLDLSMLGTTYSSASNLPNDAKKVQDFLKKLFFTKCSIFDYYGLSYGKPIYVYESNFKNGFKSFMDQLNMIYGNFNSATQDEINYEFAKLGAEDPFKNRDLRISTYTVLKSLYDKWICNSQYGADTWKFSRNRSAEKGMYELDNFIYVDSYYRNIGYDLTVNLTKIVDWVSKCLPTAQVNSVEGIMSYNNRTIYEYLTDIAQDCGAILLAVPQKYMFDDADNIREVFTPIPSCLDWDDDTFTYMFLYSYRPSEHLGETASNVDMNGYSPDGDGFELTDEDIVGALFTSEEKGYAVPAFGVTFAKGNQSYFKNISLSTKQHGVTEVGLNATFQIAAKNSEVVRQTTLFGQDIYKVYANNSYECTVEMMGDMQIFPPMYFQLNNVPMWRGAYIIKKVTHNIKAGDATTTIVGVRQNKYLIPFVDGTIVSLYDGGGALPESTATEISSLSVITDASNGAGVRNIVGDRKLTIGEDKDLDSNDISRTKPIIVLTAGHSTDKSGKWREHSWATKLIKDYIIPKLKQQTFKDGTSYEKHVVMGGRKDKPNSESSGYDFGPVRRLVKKYGSDCVISVAVHWNGDGGCYFSVFYGREAEDGTKYFRADSRKFGSYMREAARKVYEKKDSYTTMPLGMMDQGIKEEKQGSWCYLLRPTNTDPGTGFPYKYEQVDCACILTENWFPNFYPKTTRKVDWTKDTEYMNIDPETNAYMCGRGWLESNDGCNVIGDMHVNAIVNYINSLSE